MIDLYLMSPPGIGWTLRGRSNFRSREAPAVDARAARREWLTLAEAIEARGGTVVALASPSAELTGMPYAAECGHIVVPRPELLSPTKRGEFGAQVTERPKFLLPRMAALHRRGEREHWARLAARMGLEVIDPGASIWEAQGDVAEMDGVTLLFFGGRTDRAGMEAAAAHIEGELLPMEIREPAFHGNMAVLPLPAIDRLLVCRDVVEKHSMERLAARFGADCLLAVTEAEIRCYATNGLPIGRDLLAPSITPARVVELVTQAGMNVVPLDMHELCEKAGGASRCLVSRARLDPRSIDIPQDCTLASIARSMRAEDADEAPAEEVRDARARR